MSFFKAFFFIILIFLSSVQNFILANLLLYIIKILSIKYINISIIVLISKAKKKKI